MKRSVMAGLVDVLLVSNVWGQEKLRLPRETTDEQLAEKLKGLTQLKWLRLDGTQVTDAGLVHLKGLRNLETLWLKDTNVTEAGVQELQKALPDCWIWR